MENETTTSVKIVNGKYISETVTRSEIDLTDLENMIATAEEAAKNYAASCDERITKIQEDKESNRIAYEELISQLKAQLKK